MGGGRRRGERKSGVERGRKRKWGWVGRGDETKIEGVREEKKEREVGGVKKRRREKEWKK